MKCKLVTGPHAPGCLVTLNWDQLFDIITSTRLEAITHLRAPPAKVQSLRGVASGGDEETGAGLTPSSTGTWPELGTLSPLPPSKLTGVRAQEGDAKSGCQFPETVSFPRGLGDSGNCQTLQPPPLLKCDRWAEFSCQFKHFALICVLVCILFWETNFKTSFAHRPSKLTGALSSFRVGCSSDSRQAAAKRPCCPGPPSITLWAALCLRYAKTQVETPCLLGSKPSYLASWRRSEQPVVETLKIPRDGKVTGTLTSTAQMCKPSQASQNRNRCKLQLHLNSVLK